MKNLKVTWALDAASALGLLITLVVIDAPVWAWVVVLVCVALQKMVTARYEQQYAANKLKRKLAGG
jgi:hypothetical protein